MKPLSHVHPSIFQELLFTSDHDECWWWTLLLFPVGMNGGPAPGTGQIQSGAALCKDWSLPPSYSHCGDLKWISSCWQYVILGCSKAGLYVSSWALVSFRTISDLLHFWFVCVGFDFMFGVKRELVLVAYGHKRRQCPSLKVIQEISYCVIKLSVFGPCLSQ